MMTASTAAYRATCGTNMQAERRICVVYRTIPRHILHNITCFRVLGENVVMLVIFC